MADPADPFYAPGRIIPQRQPQPGRHVWTLTKNDRRVHCELRVDGEWGTEVQVFRDGEFRGGRRFPSFELAQGFADEERRVLEREGWTEPRE